MAYRSPNGYSGGDDRDLDRDVRGDRNNDGPGQHNTHLIEHLATFTVNRETGILYPADGMRRLLQLEQTNGIWSQKMQLCLDNQWVLIMDYETGSEMERFPANSIEEPTAYTSQDPMEMYNNILVFIVNNPSHHPEMHIFQCQSISAQDLVEDLQQLRLGKTLTRSHKSIVPPPISHKAPPNNMINHTKDYHHHSKDYHGSDSELTANNDDSSSTTSEKYERDVTILNHCFDDIEKFIARLQHAAAAARELERRRKNRKNKKRDMGDGMLTMRTKPPPEKEFIDIFQKFKLSFNLLAKLKAHIHDPNAPELVHFLFTPLALIVEAAHDTYFDQHLPHNVIAPLLTREAVNLLTHCVTSKETELWHSLGSAWSIPRDQYKGHVPQYHPTFMDGWSPDFPIIDDPNDVQSDYPDLQTPNQDLIDSSHHHHHQDLHQTIGDSTKSDISVDSIETGFSRSQQNFLEDLQMRGANIVQVTYPRTANNEKELTVVRGEFLEILDNNRKWWKARNSRGQIAHVPNTIVTPYHPAGNSGHMQPYPKNHREESPMDRMNGGHGSNVPDHIQARLGKKDEGTGAKSGIPPPPPPPLPPPAPIASAGPSTPTTPVTTLKRNAPERQSLRSMHQEELTTVLNLFNQRNKRDDLDIKQTPESYINQKSSPKEVQAWLLKKEFGANIREKLKGFNGYQLLQLKKNELDMICGEKEGKRLHSQLELQRRVSGFQTVRSSELLTILAKARQKIETSNYFD